MGRIILKNQPTVSGYVKFHLGHGGIVRPAHLIQVTDILTCCIAKEIPDGAEKCALFAEKLRTLAGIETVLWDERCTTVSAHRYLNQTNTRGKKRKAVVDAVAATIILESYLAYRKNTAI